MLSTFIHLERLDREMAEVFINGERIEVYYKTIEKRQVYSFSMLPHPNINGELTLLFDQRIADVIDEALRIYNNRQLDLDTGIFFSLPGMLKLFIHETGRDTYMDAYYCKCQLFVSVKGIDSVYHFRMKTLGDKIVGFSSQHSLEDRKEIESKKISLWDKCRKIIAAG